MIPICKKKYNSESIRTPKNFEAYRRSIGKWPKFKAPESIIISYDDRMMDYVEKNYDIEKCRAFCGDFWFLKDTNNKVAIYGNWGIGAALIATRIEEFIQFGIKNFISIGEAGGIPKELNIGDIVVCNKALRDDGVSPHYLKPAKFVSASKELTEKIILAAKKRNIPFKIGPTWTLDTIYRQTKAEIKQFQKENILTIDMETAAIFAIAQYRKVKAGAILTVSDSFKNLKWDPKFHETTESLQKIFEIAKETLSK
jgi:uridine phosphorylase